MKIALVHDDLIQHGGAERLFEAMMEVFPKADVFTSMTSWETSPNSSTRRVTGLQPDGFSFGDAGSTRRVEKSFMQKLPFKEKLYRHYFPLYPLAFESFDFTKYDLVISSSTRFAHGVVTRPETLHICYMNTPPRMFWEPQTYFEQNAPLSSLLSPLLSYLRLWDYTAAQRVDYFIANSKTPQARIKKYYGRDAQIIYPFVDLGRFDAAEENPTGFSVNPSGWGIGGFSADNQRKSANNQRESGYFLVVSRLASWKRIDLAVEACNRLKLPLKIIGEGPDFQRLKKLAGPMVEFLGGLTDEEVVSYYQGCRAFLFPQKEDFGITPLEAMAAGKPVIAFKAGGALETVIDGETGRFFFPQTVEALAEVLKDFDRTLYQSENCRARAEKFGKGRFQKELKSFVEDGYRKHAGLL